MSGAVNNTGVPYYSGLLFEEIAHHFFTIRYVSISACAWLFYDHLLTAGREFQFVWKAPNNIAKSMFLFYRYTSPVMVSLVAYAMSGMGQGLSEELILTFSAMGVVFNAFADAIAILHVSALWSRNTTILKTLLCIFFFTTVAAITCVGIAMPMFNASIRYSQLFNACTSQQKPTLLAAAWAAGLSFNLCMLFFIVLNAYDRPRDQSTMLVLDRDGLGYFALVAFIRLSALILSLKAPISIFGLVTIVTWPCFSINLARFVFRLRSQKTQTNGRTVTTEPVHGNDMELKPYLANTSVGRTRSSTLPIIDERQA